VALSFREIKLLFCTLLQFFFFSEAEAFWMCFSFLHRVAPFFLLLFCCFEHSTFLTEVGTGPSFSDFFRISRSARDHRIIARYSLLSPFRFVLRFPSLNLCFFPSPVESPPLPGLPMRTSIGLRAFLSVQIFAHLGLEMPNSFFFDAGR